MHPVFPKEILAYSTEHHRFKNLKKYQSIYLIILFSFSSLLISLPFIKIDLYKNTQGTIRSEKDKKRVSSPIDGRVDKVYISENSAVSKGDTLVSLDDSAVIQELNMVNKRHFTLSVQVSDLNYLCHSNQVLSDSLKSALYTNQLSAYRLKLEGLRHKWANDLIRFKRKQRLFDNGLISASEFDKAAFGLKTSRNEMELFKKRQNNSWQLDLYQKNAALDSLNSKKLRLEKIKGLHHITAPETGNIVEFKGLERNNFLYAGSSIAGLSPQTDLVVECYIAPSDIGLIHRDQEVKFRIRGISENNYQTADGRVIHVQEHITKINQLPGIRVLCAINDTKRFQNKKLKASLYKGMALTVRFFIKKSSLFQLLFGKLEDWYNPIDRTYVTT